VSVFCASASLQNRGEGVIARESGVHADSDCYSEEVLLWIQKPSLLSDS